jgi:hypothetical protein
VDQENDYELLSAAKGGRKDGATDHFQIFVQGSVKVRPEVGLADADGQEAVFAIAVG